MKKLNAAVLMLALLATSAMAATSCPTCYPTTNAGTPPKVWGWSMTRSLMFGYDSTDDNKSVPLRVDPVTGGLVISAVNVSGTVSGNVVEQNVNAQTGGIATDGSLTFPAKMAATIWTITAAQLLDNKLIIPFSALGVSPAKVRRILIVAQDGSATNFDYIGYTASGNGFGATAQAFDARKLIRGGQPAVVSLTLTGDTRPIYAVQPYDYTFDTGYIVNAYGTSTLYAATSDVLAQGVRILRIIIWYVN